MPMSSSILFPWKDIPKDSLGENKLDFRQKFRNLSGGYPAEGVSE